MTKDILIQGEKYDIFYGANLSGVIAAAVAADNVFLITDTNVEKLYGDDMRDESYVIAAGENSKKLAVIGRICEAMYDAGCNRKTTVVALGGGVVGDIAGFAASVYMRGVEVIQIPTTLLAMADSSVGGKTGVNLTAKNIVGTFHQPAAIYTSLHFLKTLPRREILCGMGEIFKTALLDKSIYSAFPALANKACGAKEPAPECFADILQMCIRFKLDIVTRDEKESELRKILNVGHTLGHGLEVYDKYRLSHGEYVAHGILLEAAVARDIGLIEKEHSGWIEKYGKMLTGGAQIKFDSEKLADICAGDKKNSDAGISIILSYLPGKTEEVVLKHAELIKTLNRIKGN